MILLSDRSLSSGANNVSYHSTHAKLDLNVQNISSDKCLVCRHNVQVGNESHAASDSSSIYLPWSTAECVQLGVSRFMHANNMNKYDATLPNNVHPYKTAQNWRAIVILLSDRSLSSGPNNVSYHSAGFENERCRITFEAQSMQLSVCTTCK